MRPRASRGSASVRASPSAPARSRSPKAGPSRGKSYRDRGSPDPLMSHERTWRSAVPERAELERLREFGVALAADLFVVGPGDDGHLVDADALLQLDDARHHLG